MPSAILRKLEENIGGMGMGKIRVVLRVANSASSPTVTNNEESLRKHFQVSHVAKFPFIAPTEIMPKAANLVQLENLITTI